MKLLTMLIFLTASMMAADGTQPAKVMMEAARKKEVVDGDLKGAIKLYGEIVAKHKSDRAVAAMALVRMADAYQKMGDSESRKIYDQVVREYGDQKEAVTMARVRLGGNVKPGAPTTTLIGSGPKADYLGSSGGRVSVDGHYLSFTDWETGDLALYEIGTGTHRRLTEANEKKGIFADQSVVSRDGKLIAYVWYNVDKAELRIANVAGDPSPRRLYQNSGIGWYIPWDWSPDGRWLAVRLFRKDNTQQIGLISISDGSLRVLKSIDWRGTRGMFFSPDGKYLGFDLPDGDASQKRDIFVLAIDGSRELPAVVHRADDLMMGWSPDGTRLLFASDRSGAMDIWGLLITDGKTQGPPELLKSDVGRVAQSKGMTRSGALFYMTRTGSGQPSAIHVAEYDLANRKRVSEGVEITNDDGQENRGPAWSPDGKYLAYTSMRVGPGPRTLGSNPAAGDTLVIRSADTYQVVRQWRGKLSYFYAYTLRWMRDARAVLVKGADLKGRTGIFRIDVETGNVSPVRLNQPGGGWVDLISLSPDGRKLFYSQGIGRGEANVVERDLISGHEKELMRAAHLRVGAVSPDGSYLSVARSDLDRRSTTLVLLPLDRGERREILAPWKFIPDQCWTPDGRSLIGIQQAEGAETSATFWRVPIDGGSPVRAELEEARACRAHPGGRRVAYVVQDNLPQKQQVWKLENFLPAANGAK